MELTKDFLYEQYIVQDKSSVVIAKEFGCGIAKVEYWVKQYNLNFKRTDPDRVFNLKHIDKTNPIFCYYAGLVATDGYLDYKNKRISLRVNNVGSKEVFEALRTYFEYVRPVREYYNKTHNRPCYDITIPNQCIFNELKDMGIYGDKNNRTYSTKWFNSASADCQKMFLRGILDGDGNFHNGAFRLSMKSESFVLNLIHSFNTYTNDTYTLKFTSNSSGRKYPNVTLHKADTKKVFDWVYEGYEQYRFSDKYEKYMLTR